MKHFDESTWYSLKPDDPEFENAHREREAKIDRLDRMVAALVSSGHCYGHTETDSVVDAAANLLAEIDRRIS